MREFDEAVGRLLGCAASLEMDFESEWSGETRYIRLHHRSHVSTVIAAQDRGQFTLVSEQRVSAIDGRELTESYPFEEFEWPDPWTHEPFPNHDYSPFSGSVDGTSYFDGVRVATPLFVYDESFGPRQLDRIVTRLGDMAVKTFAQATERLDLSDDEIHSADETGKAPSEVTEKGDR